MDDSAYHRFFLHPTQTFHRQYEALRAIFVDARSQKEVAEEFGFHYSYLRQLVRDFRRHCDADPGSSESPFFETSPEDVSSEPLTRSPNHS